MGRTRASAPGRQVSRVELRWPVQALASWCTDGMGNGRAKNRDLRISACSLDWYKVSLERYVVSQRITTRNLKMSS